MSSTNPPAESLVRSRPRGLVPDRTPASEIFSQIDECDELCPRCYRQKFDVYPTSDERLADRSVVVLENGEESVELEQLVRTVAWTTRDHVPPSDGESMAELEKTICECGDVDQSEIRTRTRDEAVAHASNISAVLDRWGVEHDWLELLERVRDAKTDPDTAGKDALAFDLGVTAAVRLGRDRDPEQALEIVLERH
jgi:hypothetical protein